MWGAGPCGKVKLLPCDCTELHKYQQQGSDPTLEERSLSARINSFSSLIYPFLPLKKLFGTSCTCNGELTTVLEAITQRVQAWWIFLILFCAGRRSFIHALIKSLTKVWTKAFNMSGLAVNSRQTLHLFPSRRCREEEIQLLNNPYSW